MVNDEFYLSLALKEAWKYQGLTYPNPAVGALILDGNGKILSIAAHKRANEAHAELNAVREAFYEFSKDKNILTIEDPFKLHAYLLKNHNNLFKNSTIYVTLEPCSHIGKTPSCATLIRELGFKRVVIGSMDPNKTASGGADILKKSNIEVKTGVMKKECDLLIEPFKKWQEGKSFIFFKLAQTQNGAVTGGVISSLKSREFVHKLREKIDLLVIGGNTVRVDRPILDCRLINSKKAPDILIFTKNPEKIDRNIPLFDVKNRNVFVESSLNRIFSYKFVMIEGGEGMLNATKEILDWFLLFISPKFSSYNNLKSTISLKRLHFFALDDDIVVWNKVINDF